MSNQRLSHRVRTAWVGAVAGAAAIAAASGCESDRPAIETAPSAAAGGVLGRPVVDAVTPLGEAALALGGSHQEDARPVALVFVSDVCPICNRYSPELRRLADDYADRVDVRLVYPLPDATPERLEEHSREYDLAGLTLWDPKQQLSRWSGARVTPEAVVLTPDGAGYRLVYRGRIDDWYVDFGKPRAAPTQRDLRDALEAVVAGDPAPFLQTKAVGCIIPTLPE